MSYSLIQKCDKCNKQDRCADGKVIKGAVQGIIHSLDMNCGHLGGGTVTHDCVYGFEENTEKV